MSNYVPWCSAGVAAAKRANRAAAARHRAEKRAEYDEYAAESRACGYEVEPFDEWMGEASAKAKAYDRMPDPDDWDLY